MNKGKKTMFVSMHTSSDEVEIGLMEKDVSLSYDEGLETDTNIQVSSENRDDFDTGISSYNSDEGLCNQNLEGEVALMEEDVYHGMDEAGGYVSKNDMQIDEGESTCSYFG